MLARNRTTAALNLAAYLHRLLQRAANFRPGVEDRHRQRGVGLLA